MGVLLQVLRILSYIRRARAAWLFLKRLWAAIKARRKGASMQIVKARVGQENESRWFCDVEVEGAPAPVVCRGPSIQAACEKAKAYVKEHYGLDLKPEHVEPAVVAKAAPEVVLAAPEVTDVDDVPPPPASDAVTTLSDAAPTSAEECPAVADVTAPAAAKKASKGKKAPAVEEIAKAVAVGEQDAD